MISTGISSFESVLDFVWRFYWRLYRRIYCACATLFRNIKWKTKKIFVILLDFIVTTGFRRKDIKNLFLAKCLDVFVFLFFLYGASNDCLTGSKYKHHKFYERYYFLKLNFELKNSFCSVCTWCLLLSYTFPGAR